MKLIQKVLGYSWAFLASVIILATFIGNQMWAEKLVTATGVTISPWCTGGEVERIIDHNDYQTLLHRPVFDGLIGERRKGFVQVNWKANEGKELPEVIREDVDYDRDGVRDFTIEFNTKKDQAKLTAESAAVEKIGEIIPLENERVVRVKLKREK